MKTTTVLSFVALAVLGGCAVDSKAESADAAGIDHKAPIEVAQAPAATDAPAAAAASSTAAAPAAADAGPDASMAPEITQVSGQLVKADGAGVSGGVVYFVFQSRLNEIPHAGALEKVKAMAEVAAPVDDGGTFTLKMKPGNFALVYDPAATAAPEGPGAESMTMMKRLTPDQVQSRIAAIKENASKGLPVANGKIGEAFVVENRFVRPPVSDFGQLALQSAGMVTVKAVDDKGEAINFPATLRLRGKNGDILEPHTPSVSKKAEYEFHDLMPQSYQVYALGSLPRPGAGDAVTTPTINNDQLIYTGESLSHEVVVEQPAN